VNLREAVYYVGRSGFETLHPRRRTALIPLVSSMSGAWMRGFVVCVGTLVRGVIAKEGFWTSTCKLCLGRVSYTCK